MRTARFLRIGFLCLGMLSLLALGVTAREASSAKAAEAVLSEPGHVLLMRHAHAPGVGDPPGMTLKDCASQRNLDERGRSQAVRLGERLRAAGVSGVRVYTSQWCRCRDTARLLALGRVEELPALNSFFEQPEVRDERLRELRAFLGGLPRGGAPVVLVTHQVTVTALTGYFPSSGAGVVLRLTDKGGFEHVATLTTED
jgi:broad specificity phosphatase PhoE